MLKTLELRKRKCLWYFSLKKLCSFDLLINFRETLSHLFILQLLQIRKVVLRKLLILTQLHFTIKHSWFPIEFIAVGDLFELKKIVLCTVCLTFIVNWMIECWVRKILKIIYSMYLFIFGNIVQLVGILAPGPGFQPRSSAMAACSNHWIGPGISHSTSESIIAISLSYDHPFFCVNSPVIETHFLKRQFISFFGQPWISQRSFL